MTAEEMGEMYSKSVHSTSDPSYLLLAMSDEWSHEDARQLYQDACREGLVWHTHQIEVSAPQDAGFCAMLFNRIEANSDDARYPGSGIYQEQINNRRRLFWQCRLARFQAVFAAILQNESILGLNPYGYNPTMYCDTEIYIHVMKILCKEKV